MLRVLRAFLCVALVHLALTVSFARAAAPVAMKGKAVFVHASAGSHAGLERRSRARRRQERLRAARAVLPVDLAAVPPQPSFALATSADSPPLVCAAPPDHPPA